MGNKEELNKLLYRQISISHSLLSFLQTDDISDTIREILKDILIQFNGDRTYIFEIFPEEKIQNCIYEITAENVSEEQSHSKIFCSMNPRGGTSRYPVRKPLF